jgi:hypothetical protein
VPTVSDIEFKDIYREFGYGEAIAQDPDSLSYVVQPVRNLRLLMVDSCRWKENKENQEPVVGGNLSLSTLKWIESQLALALKDECAVLAVQHHGILEHYRNNKRYYRNYVLENHQDLVSLYNHYNVRIVMTGHFHSQDITRVSDPNEILFDVETGSLVTYPNPIRYFEITEGYQFRITSDFIRMIDSTRQNFDDYSRDYAFEGGAKIARKDLARYGIKGDRAMRIAKMFVSAYIAHLKGDETIPFQLADESELTGWDKLIVNFRKDLIESWYTDLPPSDNAVSINILSGTY